MVKDRLEELQAKSDESDKDGKKKKGKKENEKDHQISSFLKQVNKTEMIIKSLRKDVAEVKRMQGNLYCSPTVKEEDLQQMEILSDQILATSVKIRKDIELLSAGSSPQTEDTSRITSNVHQRVHTVQIDRLSSELRTILNDFRSGQADYIEKTKARLRRQKVIVGEDESNVSENQAVFTGDVIIEMQVAKSDLQDLYQREKELEDLEKKIHEVNQLFKDVSVLVSEQGETIDHIETNVNKTSSTIKSAVGILKDSKENQEKARKKMICIIGIVVLVIIILAVVLAIVFGTKS